MRHHALRRSAWHAECFVGTGCAFATATTATSKSPSCPGAALHIHGAPGGACGPRRAERTAAHGQGQRRAAKRVDMGWYTEIMTACRRCVLL